jgi:putative FmdB family regulatory protein
MPIYEYRCRSCEHEFEVLVRSSHDEPSCPRCEHRTLEKQLSVPAAPMSSAMSLPVCGPRQAAGCGLSACQQGGCQMG